MRTISRAALALTGAAALTLLAVVPANAADTVTVAVTGEALALVTTDEAGTTLTAAVPGEDSTGTLVGVTVTDNRAVVGAWIADATATAFTAPADTAATASMATAVLTYTAGDPATTGTSDAASEGDVVLSTTAAPVVTASAVSGVNESVWTADLSVAIPDGALAGTYTTIITHSIV
jgi:hypothetical protein